MSKKKLITANKTNFHVNMRNNRLCRCHCPIPGKFRAGDKFMIMYDDDGIRYVNYAQQLVIIHTYQRRFDSASVEVKTRAES